MLISERVPGTFSPRVTVSERSHCFAVLTKLCYNLYNIKYILSIKYWQSISQSFLFEDFGLFKVDVKTKTANGVEFNTAGQSSHDTGLFQGNLESKYKLKEYGWYYYIISVIITSIIIVGVIVISLLSWFVADMI